MVAVLAYTGYDMEDAMILNKSSMERGLAHGTLYKTEMIDLKQEKTKSIFASEPGSTKTVRHAFATTAFAFCACVCKL